MNSGELKEILKEHRKWLMREGGKKADLHGINLMGCSLSDADLRGANLSYANLTSADLNGANLSYANLSGVDLSWTNLSLANLTGANLSNAHLFRTILCWTNLTNANLRNVNLRNANSFRAILCGADLTDVELSGTSLHSGKFMEIKANIWTIQIHATTVRIGCRNHTHEEWMSFTDEEIAAMDARALDWWKAWRPAIETAIKNVRAQNEQDGVDINS